MSLCAAQPLPLASRTCCTAGTLGSARNPCSHLRRQDIFVKSWWMPSLSEKAAMASSKHPISARFLTRRLVGRGTGRPSGPGCGSYSTGSAGRHVGHLHHRSQEHHPLWAAETGRDRDRSQRLLGAASGGPTAWLLNLHSCCSHQPCAPGARVVATRASSDTALTCFRLLGHLQAHAASTGSRLPRSQRPLQ